MQWTQDPTGRRYSLVQGDYEVVVLHASTGEWLVLLDKGSKAVTQERCATLQEAQRWTEVQLQRLIVT